MTLRDLLDWIWSGEGLWILQGFVQAWDLIAERKERPEYPEFSPPADDEQGSWHGGPAYPTGVFEDDFTLELG